MLLSHATRISAREGGINRRSVNRWGKQKAGDKSQSPEVTVTESTGKCLLGKEASVSWWEVFTVSRNPEALHKQEEMPQEAPPGENQLKQSGSCYSCKCPTPPTPPPCTFTQAHTQAPQSTPFCLTLPFTPGSADPQRNVSPVTKGRNRRWLPASAETGSQHPALFP